MTSLGTLLRALGLGAVLAFAAPLHAADDEDDEPKRPGGPAMTPQTGGGGSPQMDLPGQGMDAPEPTMGPGMMPPGPGGPGGGAPAVRSALERHPLDASGIDVAVADGVARLEGSVPNQRDVAAAERVAGRVRGVERVDNRLEVAD